LQECAAALQTEFDAPADVIERDVMQFATELAEIGIVAVQP